MAETQNGLEALKILQATAISTILMLFFLVLLYVGIKLFIIHINKKAKTAKANKLISNLEPKEFYKVRYDNRGVPASIQLSNKIILL